MYQTGEKYVVEGLKDLAKLKFIQSCSFFWNTPYFATAVHHVFSSTTEENGGLCRITVEVKSQYPSIVNKPEVEALLHQFSDLAVALLRCMAKEFGGKKASA
ncbi:hypothetical protein G6514_008961 [Epicoccum nigrum]|nr:hypothetical protein G6514_008961 [Epicoccum nigrum]